MQIYLARNNQQAGPYTLEQVNQMLATQQVLLTDLAWHSGMSEWHPLGELTRGKLKYEPEGYPPIDIHQTTDNRQNHTFAKQSVVQSTTLATINSRALAKIIDLLLWLPAFMLPSFFLTKETAGQIEKFQGSSFSPELQQQLLNAIPTQGWQAMGIYIIAMLIIQAILLNSKGQSIGKLITKIKIVDAETEQRVNLTRIFLIRSIVFIILNLFAMPIITILDYVLGFGNKRQTLHDRLAKTKVIKMNKK